MKGLASIIVPIIILVIVVAVGVVGLSYRSGGNSSDSTQDSSSFPLSDYSGSGQTGDVSFEEVEGGTRVVIRITPPNDIPQPVHVHLGRCPIIGDILYSLNDVVEGVSETTLDVSVDTIKESSPLSVNTHKSASELDIYTSCGDVY